MVGFVVYAGLMRGRKVVGVKVITDRPQSDVSSEKFLSRIETRNMRWEEEKEV